MTQNGSIPSAMPAIPRSMTGNNLPEFAYRVSVFGDRQITRTAAMMENRIDVSGLGNSSVLDSLGVKGKPMTAPTQKRKQVVTEQTAPQQYVPQVGGVDYSIIKAIVSECIREYFEKQPLNESSIKTIALKSGTISLVDNGGNIYRAKLEKVGTTKDKKQ